MSAANVLVTGATGFVGVHLVARLLSEGCSVTVLVRSSSVLPAEWRDRVRIVVCDDFSEKKLRRLLDGPFEAVFHLAAYGVKPNPARHRRDIADQHRNAGRVGAAVRQMAFAHGDDGHLFGVS